MSEKGTAMNGREVELKLGDLLVSKTDSKGKITYANRTFMSVSGSPEKSLLGQPHNIIRHSDMPRGVFRFMWQTLQSGEEFFGFIKNACADGGYYWVFANVTADRDENGRLIGYFSVRRKAPREAIKQCEGLYKKMRDIEAHTSGSSGIDKSIAYLQSYVQENFANYRDAVMAMYKQDK